MTDYENVLLALALYREARGCSQHAKIGVAWVIRNRAADPRHRWPKTVPGVILQHMQFSSFNPGNVDAVFPIPPDDAWAACSEAAAAPDADPTGGAQYYHSIPPGQRLPSWAMVYPLTATIGPFRFYKQP
jgi:spore germination cell wall hydrolase CwlJ-like protein